MAARYHKGEPHGKLLVLLRSNTHCHGSPATKSSICSDAYPPALMVQRKQRMQARLPVLKLDAFIIRNGASMPNGRKSSGVR